MAHTGAMIALFPDKAYLGRMARAAQCMPHAQPIDDLHVTVCYLGTAADLDKTAIIAALQQFRSPVPMPLLLRIRGLDRFPTREDDGTNALYARIICPELHTLRDSLIASLDTVGVTVRNDFGSYTPHMTLGYAPEYLPTPNVRIPLITIPVGSIQLNWADDKPMVFTMNQAQTKEVSGPMATPAHGPGGLFSNPALGMAPVKRRSKSAQRRLGLSAKPFASQAQQRFAFGTGQPWAKRWADETDFSKLPAKVKASAENTGSGSASGGGKGYGARAGEVISGNLTRGGNGQFASAGSGGGYMPKPPKPAKKPKGGGGKGAGAKPKKPKEPKLTPEERQAEREERRAAMIEKNLTKTYNALGLMEDATYALNALRNGETVDDDGGLVKMGLAEQAADGTYRLTAAGRALHSAAKRGDVGAAKDTLSKAKDAIAAADEAEDGAPSGSLQDRLRKRDPAKDQAFGDKPEGEEKPKSGGGGGGGGKDKPTDAADPKDIARIARAGAGGKPPKGTSAGGAEASAPLATPLRAGPNREAAVGAMAERVGIGREGLQALRGAAGGGKVNPAAGAALAQAGLAVRTDNGYEATDQGRQALSALERNNTRNWQSALQNAQGRLQREAAAREREETRKKMVGLLALELELLRLKHGKHNQASHGRSTARRRASQAAYAQAKADGLSPIEARAFAREQGLQAQGDRNQRLARMQLKGAVPAPLNAKGIDPAALPVQRFSDPNAADAAMRRQGLVKGSDLSKTEEHTLAWYQGTGHDRINAELRGVIPTRDPYTLDRATSNLDTVMQRSRLKSNVEVHRGMLMDTPEARAVLDRWQPGATFSDPAYVSTTFSRDVAQQFGAGVTPRSDVKTVDVRVRVPAGTPAMYMPTARPNSGVSSGTANEYELLLGRGLNYRVVGRSDEGGRVTVDLEVMP